ncbi:hypothetical protein CLOM621_05966 [Clostridium sp. M62/1]|nr:hypothetical protein CLOM621_05966 [Clostridium sp. M62/1]
MVSLYSQHIPGRGSDSGERQTGLAAPDEKTGKNLLKGLLKKGSEKRLSLHRRGRITPSV